MAVKYNPEGSPECPEFSKDGVRIRRLLDRVIRMCGAEEKPVADFVAERSADNDDEENETDDGDVGRIFNIT